MCKLLLVYVLLHYLHLANCVSGKLSLQVLYMMARRKSQQEGYTLLYMYLYACIYECSVYTGLYMNLYACIYEYL